MMVAVKSCAGEVAGQSVIGVEGGVGSTSLDASAAVA